MRRKNARRSCDEPDELQIHWTDTKTPVGLHEVTVIYILVCHHTGVSALVTWSLAWRYGVNAVGVVPAKSYDDMQQVCVPRRWPCSIFFSMAPLGHSEGARQDRFENSPFSCLSAAAAIASPGLIECHKQTKSRTIQGSLAASDTPDHDAINL